VDWGAGWTSLRADLERAKTIAQNKKFAKWVRFTAGPVNRRNRGRAAVLPLWLAVERGFAAWAGAPAGESLNPLDRLGVDVRHSRADRRWRDMRQ